MNFLEKIIWRWQAKSKLHHSDIGIQYTAIRKLGEIGNPNDLEIIVPLLAHSSQLIRNATALALNDLIGQQPVETIETLRNQIVAQLEQANSLREKLSLIEVMRSFPLQLRESLLAPMVEESQSDLQYAVISSLIDSSDLTILDTVLHASDTPDLLLRRMALQTWYIGLSSLERGEVQDYITPRLHYLVRAAYELQTDGEFLRQSLSYANKQSLPHPKAYPDFIIRYMTELLGNWEYDPDAFRSLHAIMVPSYFTFDGGNNEERPFVVL